MPEAEDAWQVAEASGRAAAALHEIGCLGVEEDASGGEVAGRATLLAYFELDVPVDAVRRRLAAERGLLAEVGGTSVLADPGWVERWNRSLRPVDVGRRLTIVPGEGDAPPGRLALRVRPGRAFGTGHHESTRLALEALEDVVAPGSEVLDVGTGTGILALAAVVLGAVRAVAIDVDPVAVAVARENLAGSPAAAAVELHVADGVPEAVGHHDVVVANITADVIERWLPALVERVRAGGALVLAGLLATDRAAMDRRLAELGVADRDWRDAGEWTAVVARRQERT